MKYGLITPLRPRAAFRNIDKALTGLVQLPETAPMINADVYYHEAAFPVSSARLLGTFKINEPIYFKLALATDTDVAIRTIGRTSRGLKNIADVAEAEPDIFLVKGLGAGDGGGIGLRSNNGYSYGSTLPSQKFINLLQSFRLVDDPVHQETDLITFGVPTGVWNLKTDLNASGQIAFTQGSITSGSKTLICSARLNLQAGMGIYVQNAKPGAPLITTIESVSDDGLTFQLVDAATATATNQIVQADDTQAVQAWINKKGDLTAPPGYYRLTSSIVVPVSSEGFSVVLHGSGWDQTQFVFQHGGDGFVPDADFRIDSVVFRDISIVTGTVGNDTGLQDANNRGIGIRWTYPTLSGVYDNFAMENVRMNGWGRWAIWTDNLEVSWFHNCIFRNNKVGHVAFVAPDTIEFPKQPNANTLTSCTFDQAGGGPDNLRLINGSLTAGSRVLSLSTPISTTDRGLFVVVPNAGTNGVHLYTFIDSIQTTTSVTLAHEARSTVNNVQVQVYPRMVASILLVRANDTVISGATIQGNYDVQKGTSTAADANAIRAVASNNLRITGVHEEDAGGFGGAAIHLEDCSGVTIENWGGTSPGNDEFGNPLYNAHQVDFSLTRCHGVSVRNSYFNDRPQFDIDSQSSEIDIDSSWIIGFNNLWQADHTWDRLRVGSGVRTAQAASPLTNQQCGNEYLYDSFFGRDLLRNGRFIDSPSLDGWTHINKDSWWTLSATSKTRYGTYVHVDATAVASGGVQTIIRQSVAIPDSLPAGGFTLGYDWMIETQVGAPNIAGQFTEIRLHPSTGIDETHQWFTRPYSYVMNVWQSSQLKCWLGSGTGRTIELQINVTPGPNNVKIRFTNFRLMAGKHIFGSWERGVHDFGGRLFAPLQMEPLDTSVYTPPPTGSPIISLINDAGALKLGANGAYVTLGGVPGGSGHIIQDETVDLPPQPRLNFAGAGVQATNNSSATPPRTDVTVLTAASTVPGTGVEGTISTGLQDLAGFKRFYSGIKLIVDTGIAGNASVPLLVQWTNTGANGHIQDWWTTGGSPLGWFDTQATFHLGIPSGMDGVLELATGAGAFVTQIRSNAVAQKTVIYLPLNFPSNGQVLQVQTATIGNGFINTQWANPSSGGHTIAEEGGVLATQRAVLNFKGAGVLAADNSGTSQTDVTVQTASQTLEGCVSISLQDFKGWKRFNSGVSIIDDNSVGGNAAVPLVVQWANISVNGSIQEWWSTTKLASLDTQAVFHLGIANGVDGVLELSTGAGSFVTQLRSNSVAQKTVIYLPLNFPSNGQVLSVSSATIGNGNIFTQWSNAGTGSGITGTGTMTANQMLRWVTAGAAGTVTDAGFKDDGTTITVQRSLIPVADDGSISFGNGTNRFGGIHTRTGFFVYPVGSSASGPKAAGFTDPQGGEYTRMLLSGNQSVAQGGNGRRTQFTGFYGLEFRGCRNDPNAPSMVTTGAGSIFDPAVNLITERDVVSLQVSSPSGVTLTQPMFQLVNNTVEKFRITAQGTIVAQQSGTLFGANTFTVGSWTLTPQNRTVIADAISGGITLTLPAVSGCRGQIYDIINLRAMQRIFDAGTSGHTNTIRIQVTGGDSLNNWNGFGSAGNGGQSWDMSKTDPPTNGKIAVKLIADATLNVWWLLPYDI